MISNLSALFHALGKAALLTGIGPALMLAVVTERWLSMGLYNFMPQFVPKIRSGEKTHTIRAMRIRTNQVTLCTYTQACGGRERSCLCVSSA